MRKFLLLALVAMFVSGCTRVANQPAKNSSNRPTDSPIKVVATVGMVADLVREVGGEFVEVEQICGTGVDPHLYKATRDDVRTLGSADVVFYCGLMLEGKMTDTLVKLARSRPVIAVTEAVDPSVLLEPDELAGHYDPHVWMDVAAWSNCVAVVESQLVELDSEHADNYHQNAKSLVQRLDALHQYGQKVIGSIPEDRRVLVTSHDAFNYLGRAYGLDVQGVQGISTDSEAGLQRVNELVDMLVAKRVQSVFVESSVPRKSIEALVEGARAKGHTISIGGELFSDAMGADGSYEGTYIGMLDHNLTTIALSLGGQAPDRGLNEQLSH